jgi:hypothetical protein
MDSYEAFASTADNEISKIPRLSYPSISIKLQKKNVQLRMKSILVSYFDCD